MKKPLLLPLLAGSLLVACATPMPDTAQNKPTVIGEQDIQQMVQQAQQRALDARDSQADQQNGTTPPVLAGAPAVPVPPKPVVAGGKHPALPKASAHDR